MLLKLADTVLILINTGPSNVNYKLTEFTGLGFLRIFKVLKIQKRIVSTEPVRGR